MLALLYLMLRGTPYIYQGEELGMRNCRYPEITDYDDCSTYNQYHRALNEGYTHEEAMEFVYRTSRDNSRTPFQWDDSENAGFSKGKPWLKVNENYREINAKEQEDNEDSLLNWYRKLIFLRKKSEYAEILIEGSIVPVYEDVENLIGYMRIFGDEKLLILCNYQGQERKIALEESWKKMLAGNYGKLCQKGEKELLLRPYEAVILEIE